jgi:hypothetical protein
MINCYWLQHLSAILNKEILFESSVPQQSISKISLSNQHLKFFLYEKVGINDSTCDESPMILHITVPATKIPILA